MKLFPGTIPMLLYAHLVFRMLNLEGDWVSVQIFALTAFVVSIAYGFLVPILLVYPGYLERFTGKRPVFLVLVISILSLVWIPVWGLMVADLDTQLKQPFVAESGILYFISFNLLYAYVFKLYEKMGFYDWMKRMQGSFFYNDPPTHIRDFDKTASIYISTVLVILLLIAYSAFEIGIRR